MRVLTFTLLTILGISIAAEHDWWQNGNFYQIYPRSFKDTDGDGVGDLNGITEKLQHLKDIGMDGLWLSPIFKSPMTDFGYDISDYTQIHAEYGTIADLMKLKERAHHLGMRIILDFVPNHTSDEHEWFQRSVNNDPEYRDFYVWHDGVINATTGQRQAPSNWNSVFRFSAWEWNEQRQQYYLHQFGVKQPDLNYRNPAVVQTMKNVMHYWLDLGIDGFRIDAVPFIFESVIDAATGTYPDEPLIDDVNSCPDPTDYCHLQHIHTFSLPETIDMTYHWREIVDEYKREHNTDTKVLLAEAYTSFENLMRMYGDAERPGAHIPFNFDMLPNLSNQSRAADLEYNVHHWLDNMPAGAYANWVLGNHDRTRIATLFGVQRIDLINIFLQTLPGIAITYYGEEYGMENVYVSWEDTVDLKACSADPDTYQVYSRDPVRTPLRWDSSANAGFSSGTHTWLPVGDGYEENNVAAQWADEKSHLKIFQALTKLRKQEPAFDAGDFESRVVENVFLYKRRAIVGDAFVIVLNMGDDNAVLDLAKIYDGVPSSAEVVVSSLQSGIRNGQHVSTTTFAAKAYNGYVLRLV